MGRFIKRYCYLAALFIALIVVGATLQSHFYPSGVMPPFTLVDQHGRRVTEQDLQGSPKVLFFGFTGCSSICPLTMTHLAEVQELLRRQGQPAPGVVLVTIDPEHDNPQVLKDYLAHFPLEGIMGLTGPEESLKPLYDAFRVYPGSTAGNAGRGDHSGLVYLIDERGHLREVFTLQTKADDMARKIKGIIAKGET